MESSRPTASGRGLRRSGRAGDRAQEDKRSAAGRRRPSPRNRRAEEVPAAMECRPGGRCERGATEERGDGRRRRAGRWVVPRTRRESCATDGPARRESVAGDTSGLGVRADAARSLGAGAKGKRRGWRSEGECRSGGGAERHGGMSARVRRRRARTRRGEAHRGVGVRPNVAGTWTPGAWMVADGDRSAPERRWGVTDGWHKGGTSRGLGRQACPTVTSRPRGSATPP
jgi:hypothetical protein